jgi:hypothetical protein
MLIKKNFSKKILKFLDRNTLSEVDFSYGESLKKGSALT